MAEVATGGEPDVNGAFRRQKGAATPSAASAFSASILRSYDCKINPLRMSDRLLKGAMSVEMSNNRWRALDKEGALMV